MNKKVFSLSPMQIVTIITPLAVLALFTCISFTNIMNDIIKSSIKSKAADLNEKVEYEVRMVFESPALAVESLAYSTNQLYGESSIQELLNETAKQYPQCASFYFGSADSPKKGGFVITTDSWKATSGFDHTTRPWFTAAVTAGGTIAAGDPYLNTRTNKMCIFFTKAVYNSKHKLMGVVGCDIMLDRLTEIINKIQISENTETYILDQKGLYLTNPDSSFIMKNSYFDNSTLDLDKYNVSNYLDGNTKSFVSKNRFYAVRKLASAPWFVVMEGPMSDFTGSFKFWLLIILIIVGIMIVGNVTFNGYLMNKSKMKEMKVSDQLLSETQSLVVASRETAATSQDQSAAVKEIVATMEDSNTLSENIATKIKDVSSVANKTSSDVL
ncbi:MAG: cache domain-containing protein, partial [Treponema sp.]|nr:cache domain-containing protein [Treponema sp.]